MVSLQLFTPGASVCKSARLATDPMDIDQQELFVDDACMDYPNILLHQLFLAG
jgi:hypothetical protein